jgi:hypothetical protein
MKPFQRPIFFFWLYISPLVSGTYRKWGWHYFYIGVFLLSFILSLVGCDYRRGMGWWMDLLITYTHHSELQVIAALSLIPTPYKLLHAKSSPACSFFNSNSLATGYNSGYFFRLTHSGSILTSPRVDGHPICLHYNTFKTDRVENTVCNSNSLVAAGTCLPIRRLETVCVTSLFIRLSRGHCCTRYSMYKDYFFHIMSFEHSDILIALFACWIWNSQSDNCDDYRSVGYDRRSPAEVHRRFWGICLLLARCLRSISSTVKIQSARLSETSLNFYRATWHHIAEDSRYSYLVFKLPHIFRSNLFLPGSFVFKLQLTAYGHFTCCRGFCLGYRYSHCKSSLFKQIKLEALFIQWNILLINHINQPLHS